MTNDINNHDAMLDDLQYRRDVAREVLCTWREETAGDYDDERADDPCQPDFDGDDY